MSTSAETTTAAAPGAPKTTRTFADISADLHAYLGELLQGRVDAIEIEDLFTALADLTTLYTKAAATPPTGQLDIPGEKSTTTDVLRLVTALMRSQDINPFDLALWFSRENPENANHDDERHSL